jgi:hypothetical protein
VSSLKRSASPPNTPDVGKGVGPSTARMDHLASRVLSPMTRRRGLVLAAYSSRTASAARSLRKCGYDLTGVRSLTCPECGKHAE